MAQYAIINIETIQKRIEELESKIDPNDKNSNPIWWQHYSEQLIQKEINTLKQILSQSTPLIPEISKAYDAGIKDKELSQMFDNPKGRYVYNLKLDI